MSVTGTLKAAGRLGVLEVVLPVLVLVTPELIVIVPEYVPGDNAVGSISTVSEDGVDPLFGATNSHAVLPLSLAVARKLSGVTESVLVIEI